MIWPQAHLEQRKEKEPEQQFAKSADGLRQAGKRAVWADLRNPETVTTSRDSAIALVGAPGSDRDDPQGERVSELRASEPASREVKSVEHCA